MLYSIYKLFSGDVSAAEIAGRRRAREALLSMDDRLLDDAGISRDLLNEGVQAWPWRKDEESGTNSSQSDASKQRQAA